MNVLDFEGLTEANSLIESVMSDLLKTVWISRVNVYRSAENSQLTSCDNETDSIGNVAYFTEQACVIAVIDCVRVEGEENLNERKKEEMKNLT